MGPDDLVEDPLRRDPCVIRADPPHGELLVQPVDGGLVPGPPVPRSPGARVRDVPDDPDLTSPEGDLFGEEVPVCLDGLRGSLVLRRAIDEEHPRRLAKRGSDQVVARFVERGDRWVTGQKRFLEEGNHDLEEPTVGVVEGGLMNEPRWVGGGVRAHRRTSTAIRGSLSTSLIRFAARSLVWSTTRLAPIRSARSASSNMAR